MLKKIKVLLSVTGTEKDELISTLIDLCEDEAKTYCGVDTVMDMQSTIIQMVVFKYNRLGTEGLVSENYNGASYNYIDEYPAGVRIALDEKRRQNTRLKVF